MSEHPLNTGHTLWFMRRQKHTRKKKEDEEGAEGGGATSGGDSEDYEKLIKKIATFKTLEQFWNVYGHIFHVSEIPQSTDFHLFREGVKPVWEDPANRRGGKLVVKVRKGLGARYWESLVLAVIGEQFGDLGQEVCGIVISIRHNEDVLSLWIRSGDNSDSLQKIRESFKKAIKLPSFVPMEYKRHDTAESAAASTATMTQANNNNSSSSNPRGGPPQTSSSTWRTRGSDWRS